MALVGVLAGGVAELRWSRLEGAERPARFRLQDATASLFRKFVNDAFTACPAGEGRTRLVLARVNDLPVMKNVEQFSLMFYGPAGAAIPNGTHRFQHPELGSFDLFIVAVGMPSNQHVAYEACFSRHVGAVRSAGL